MQETTNSYGNEDPNSNATRLVAAHGNASNSSVTAVQKANATNATLAEAKPAAAVELSQAAAEANQSSESELVEVGSDDTQSNFGRLLKLFDPSKKQESAETRELADELLETFKLVREKKKQQELAKQAEGLESINKNAKSLNQTIELKKARLQTMKTALAQKLTFLNKATTKALKAKLTQSHQKNAANKTPTYELVTKLAAALEVETTPDVVSLMGDPSKASELATLLLTRAAEAGKQDSEIEQALSQIE